MQAPLAIRSSYLQQSLLDPMLIGDKRLAFGPYLLAFDCCWVAVVEFALNQRPIAKSRSQQKCSQEFSWEQSF
jgi:hypothetical protein